MLASWLNRAMTASKIGGSQLSRELTNRLGRSIDPAAVSKMRQGKRRISADELLAISEITNFQPPSTDLDIMLFTEGMIKRAVKDLFDAGYMTHRHTAEMMAAMIVAACVQQYNIENNDNEARDEQRGIR